ncbi:serine/threonine-protein kinase [Pseudanabaena sp. UWO310]|uniref:serine/threonine-protein kinase n=1 Tax=Pseudanabaena sp. UWO310 TaxID=2480795 RepID=UPI0011596BF1|nr:serine/threonine-protein kinase [Pseudanabaena sp. UWO310]TYQ30457.1 serine/threonine protein kinase [Pseudanabaena sp. UWO310]
MDVYPSSSTSKGISAYPFRRQHHANLKPYQLLHNRYRILYHLGEGGFGKTFLAVDELQIPLQCVLKQLLPHRAIDRSTALILFNQEVQHLARLGEHPLIPKLLDSFEEDGEFFIVQEWVDGWTLEQEVRGAIPFHETFHEPFHEIEVRQVLQGLLPILQYLHDCQIIHRDIKPDNIIRRSSDRQLVLVDFGAAKQVANIRPMSQGTLIGSVAYAAPEQIRGQAMFASDLYSLGVTCLYLLTQTNPFDLYDIGENDWKWQAYLRQPISPNLKDILCKLLQPAIRQRYQSATEVLTDLNASMVDSVKSTGDRLSLEINSFDRNRHINHINSRVSEQATDLSPPPIPEVKLFAEDLASIASLPFMQRLIIVSIGSTLISLAIACIAFCLSIILSVLVPLQSNGANQSKSNFFWGAIGIMGLVGLGVLGNKPVSTLTKAPIPPNDKID